MAFESANEKFEGRTAISDFRAGRKYTRVYQAFNTLKTDTAATVTAGIGIAFGAAHPNDSGALCTKIDCQQSQTNGFEWRITYHYDSDIDLPEAATTSGGWTPAQAAAATNPTTRPPQWKWGPSRRITVDADRDYAGNHICNKAGDPFLDMSLEVNIPVFSVTINKATFSKAHCRAVDNSLNNATWQTDFPAYSLKCVSVEVTPMNANNSVYFAHSYTFEEAPSMPPWSGSWRYTKKMNVGPNYIDPANGKKTRVPERYGRNTGGQAYLTSTGALMSWPYSPITCDFEMFRAVDYSTLILA